MLLIYSEKITPRLEYVTRFIFEDFIKIPFTLTTDLIDFQSATGPVISYTNQRIAEEFHIHAGGLLSESDIKEQTVEYKDVDGLPVFFPTDQDSNIPFDIFSAVFFMLSRYEEYLPFTPDKYGRYDAENSICFKNSLLEKAVVDRWIIFLSEKLRQKYSQLPVLNRKYRFLPTVDIDNAYAVKNKGLLRTIGGLIKSLTGSSQIGFSQRIKILLGKEMDPFDTYEKMDIIHDGIPKKMIIFVLAAGLSKNDRGINPAREPFKKLIKTISGYSHVGLHPSWKSNSRTKGFKPEKELLESIYTLKIKISRQHFLMIKMPETYIRLEKSGIIEDYSMGYPSHVGFRAGTCTPFRFYDLTKERETEVQIMPFQVMDRTLKDYLKLNPGEAVDKINEIIGEVRAVSGKFVTIWHNEAFSEFGEWKGWTDVYDEMFNLIDNYA
ncbi:MAG: polysaccharide deacetylase family protein [Bacteroidales bacterium]|nr:polysaccharide deacetylase family protein [Bacteroidales bacterium]